MNQREIESYIEDKSTCAICCEFIGYPILQCNFGHHFCKDCLDKVDTCPSCRVSLNKTSVRNGSRNRCLEELLSQMTEIRCTHYGCEISLPYKELKYHTSTCEHKMCNCPLYECSWNGKAKDAIEHTKTAHPDRIIEIHDKIKINIDNPEGLCIDAYNQIYLKTHLEQYILLGVWVLKGHMTPSLCISTTLINTDTQEDTTFKTTFLSNKEKFTLERKPWRVVNEYKEITQSKSNLTIDWDYALRNGKTPPIFKNSDQYQIYAQPSGLNLMIELDTSTDEITETDTNTPNYIMSLTQLDICDF